MHIGSYSDDMFWCEFAHARIGQFYLYRRVRDFEFIMKLVA